MASSVSYRSLAVPGARGVGVGRHERSAERQVCLTRIASASNLSVRACQNAYAQYGVDGLHAEGT